MPIAFTRRCLESIVIGDDIVVTVVQIRGDKARLEIHAPHHVPICRGELYLAIARDNARREGLDPDDAPMSATLAALRRWDRHR